VTDVSCGGVAGVPELLEGPISKKSENKCITFGLSDAVGGVGIGVARIVG
jgi:hypothetical protein